ncbi:MAG TPA: hypothetical protein VNT92_03900 [Acidimicrobiia bacterium]|nr:hypothetical protein [Acidimicrobiia bacterium]
MNRAISMDEPWLQWTVFVLAALVIGSLITLGLSLLRRRQPNEPDFTREPKPPLPNWGVAAREIFWLTMGLSATFALIEGIFGVNLRDGVWWWVRSANAIVGIAAAILWVRSVFQRRRDAGTSSSV